eukprot:3540672-Prorocentrum_lima.AAC.1
MTSSLVGSEMCIRDSTKDRPRHTKDTLKVPGHTKEHPGHTKGTITQKTVSYTHLTLPTICSV